MTARVDCPECQGRITLDPETQNGRITCPHCGRKFRIAVPPKSAPESSPGKADRRSHDDRSDSEDEADSTFDDVDELQDAPSTPSNSDSDDWGDLSEFDQSDDSTSSDNPELRPLRSRSKSKGQSRKSDKPEKRTSKKETPPQKPKPDPKILIGAGVGVVALILVGGLIATFSGGGRPKGTAANGDTPEGSFVVITSTDASNQKAASIPSAFSAVASTSATPRVAKSRRDAGSEDSAKSTPRWSAPPDPKPAAEEYRYRDDLRIPLDSFVLKGPPELIPPVFADRGGPYALLMPNWTESPYSIVFDALAKKPKHALKEKPQDPVRVVDLRTGETAGEFSWKSSFWTSARLSPNGKFLIGTDPGPYWLHRQDVPDLIPKSGETNVLFVWQQMQDKPARKLPMQGNVLWAEFLDDTRIALYVAGEKVSLQVWDVTTGKSVSNIPLSVAPFQVRTEGSWVYWPSQMLGAVSAGGRYVAVGGVDAISLVSLEDGKEVGMYAVTLGEQKSMGEYQGVSFGLDGEELYAIFDPGRGRVTIKSWSVTTGLALREQVLPFRVTGQVTAGPDPQTIRISGYPFTAWSMNFLQSAIDNHQGTALLDATTGRHLAVHPAIIRWSDSGSVVALGALVDPIPDAERANRLPRIGIYATKGVHQVFHEAAGKTEFGLAKRPEPSAADLSSVKTVAAEPPANWSAPPRREKAPAPVSDYVFLSDRPSAFGTQELAVIRTPIKEHKQLYSTVRANEVNWSRYNSKSGQQAGDTVTLWTWGWDPNKPSYGREKPLVALSVDDRMLALRDPASPGRVDVWTADGNRICGFHPDTPKSKIEWLGWNSQGQLLTLIDGVLTAWEIPSGKAIYQIDGGYSLPVDLTVGRDWLALSGGRHIDLIDASAGTCLARCAVEVRGSLVDISISPDQGRMAAVYVGNQAAAEMLRSGQPNQTSDDLGDGTVVVWDLQTGKAEKLDQRIVRFALLHWGSPDLLMVADLATKVYDLRSGIVAMTYVIPGMWPREGFPLHRSPDGRMWGAIETGYQTWGWSSMNCPDPAQEQQAIFLKDDRDYFAAPREPVQVEIDAGTRAFSQKFGPEIAKELAQCGYKIGKGGWRMVISHAVSNSGSSLLRGTTEIPIPKVTFVWQLMDPKGKEVWRNKVETYFQASGSKYYKKTRTAYDFAPTEKQLAPMERMEYYDFGNKDPKTAMAEELMERGPGLEIAERLPKLFLKVGDSYPAFPANVGFPIRKPVEKEPEKPKG